MNTAWMENLDITYCALALAAAAVLLWRLSLAGKRSREARDRGFQRSLETLLRPGERVKLVCPQEKGRYVLTSKRLLTQTKEGFTALELKSIKSLQGTTAEGKRTVVPAKMAQLTIRAGQELQIQNTGPEFEELAKQLLAAQKKRKKP